MRDKKIEYNDLEELRKIAKENSIDNPDKKSESMIAKELSEKKITVTKKEPQKEPEDILAEAEKALAKGAELRKQATKAFSDKKPVAIPSFDELRKSSAFVDSKSEAIKQFKFREAGIHKAR